ncbi:MAG: hypothetical protein LBS62_04990 [Clostridiales bacterium]|jgi:hypothetical protein|nr:hypothetical protein [Clostridiales bacterium]
MSYISMTEYETASAAVKAEYDGQAAKHGRITNMKRTLLHSIPAFKAYMEWYTLFDLIEPFIGKRGLWLFSYSISAENDCLICSTFFRKILIDCGENPDSLTLSEQEHLLWGFGREIAKNPHKIPQEIYDKLAEFYDEEQRVLLIAFAGLMAATNLFNTVAKVPLDEILQNYRKDKNNG